MSHKNYGQTYLLLFFANKVQNCHTYPKEVKSNINANANSRRLPSVASTHHNYTDCSHHPTIRQVRIMSTRREHWSIGEKGTSWHGRKGPERSTVHWATKEKWTNRVRIVILFIYPLMYTIISNPSHLYLYYFHRNPVFVENEYGE